MNLDKLHDPFPEGSIHWRVGATKKDKTGGIALAYLNARDVMHRLDLVCGAENWQAKYPFPGCCEISIRINGEWITKSNGAGETDFEGVKGQYSDAFKRAAVVWGVGQYLYDMPNWWKAIKQVGRSYAFTDDALKELSQSYKSWLPAGHKFSPGEAKKVYDAVSEALDAGDEQVIKETLDPYFEMSHEVKAKIWFQLFNSAERSCVKKALEQANAA